MSDNPYESPELVQSAESVPEEATELINPPVPSLRGFLVMVPIAWWFVLGTWGVGADRRHFTALAKFGMTLGTIGAIIVLVYAVRGRWRLATLPIWFLLLGSLLLLWTWN
jgi:hypothetical protein